MGRRRVPAPPAGMRAFTRSVYGWSYGQEPMAAGLAVPFAVGLAAGAP